MEELLEKYGGWPVIKGDDWNSENWDWLNTSRRISNDGLIDLILDCHIEVEPRNSSKHILTVSIFLIIVCVSSRSKLVDTAGLLVE